MATVDFSSATFGAGTITVDFDSVIASGSRCYIGLGDIATRGTTANGSSKTTYNTDGLLMYFGTGDGSYYRVNGGTAISDAFGVTVHTTITLDKENSVYSYELTADDGETVLVSVSNVATTMTDLSILEAYTWQNSVSITVSNITVTTTDPTTSEVSYTVNYALEDGTVISTVSSTGYPGGTAVVSTDPIYTEDAKYIYVSSPEDLSIVANGEYTVIVHEAETYTVTVTASTGDALGTYSIFEGDTCSYSCPKYLTDSDGAVTASCNSTTYTITTSAITKDTEVTVDYTAYSDTAYFYEAEDTLGLATTIDAAKLSSGQAVRGMSTDTQYTVFTAPVSGTYTISMNLFSNNVNSTRYAYLYNNGELVDTYTVDYSINYTTVESTEVTLAAGDVIAVGASDTQVAFDYILAVCTAADTPVIEDVEVNESDKLPTLTDLTLVDGNDNSSEFAAGDTVTTYLIKVSNYTNSLGNPTLVTTAGTLTPSDTSIKYGYTSGIYKYFVIQTINIDKATTVQLTDCKDYTIE